MTCPHSLRPELPSLTERLKKLPVDSRGYPVPFFVAWLNGEPDFRMMDGHKWKACVQQNLCWVCGEPLGRFKAFVVGPMCVVNRTTSEPPSHLDCAEWSVKGCPFLARPHMVRREDEVTLAGGPVGGEMIKRNSGVSLIWVTTNYEVFKDGRGGMLIQIGDADSWSWWREGRTATRAEVEESIRTGIPALEAMCQTDHERAELAGTVEKAKVYLP